MIGFSLSGKTTVAKLIEAKLPNPKIRLDTSRVHDFLNSYPIFQDDNTITGKSFDLRQSCSKAIKKGLLTELAKASVNIIDDAANLTRKERQDKVKLIHKINPSYKFIYITIDISELDLLKRLSKFDAKNIQKGHKPAWGDLYFKIQKPQYQPVSKDEGISHTVSDTRNPKLPGV
jgi:predicted kinase